jgi:glucose/arabinose dehydrogenase
VYSYGHRNVQALAFYPNIQNGSYGVSVEHGTDRDDEVNELKPGNFGWQAGEGYDESASMTDLAKFPDAVQSVWSSGNPTIAPSGATFLTGDSWGRLNGWLAVAVLKDQKLLLLNVKNGSVGGERVYFEKEYGRLRGATMGPDENLYLTTDNGTDTILKVTAN